MFDHSGAILIDREPEYWGPVLNWLRCDKLIVADSVPLEGVLEEASFCGLTPLVALLKDRIRFRDNNSKTTENNLKHQSKCVKLVCGNRTITFQLKLNKKGRAVGVKESTSNLLLHLERKCISTSLLIFLI